ncbi:hypothetical protein J4573_27650 [Actinomadura barringtoniae]|uniref:DUF1877 family protein n=1 Tax=Actinomadura barringtoniae TaxID=1427535 RepID=A0A939PE12_9ACTN|nr:hypothetical protein [Actinomadura barringtoniae]MBO2450900.1 hypothetical protein [Actinomadura barringtoniae]
MGVLCDYFRAPDREGALSLSLNEDGLFQAAAAADLEAMDFKGIDPVVILGKLVSLLSGDSYMDLLLSGIPTDHIPGPELITPEQDEVIVVELSTLVRDTLAAATEEALAEAAPIWANTEEMAWNTWNDPDEVRPVMDELVGLARRAKASGQMLYCQICP